MHRYTHMDKNGYIQTSLGTLKYEQEAHMHTCTQKHTWAWHAQAQVPHTLLFAHQELHILRPPLGSVCI